MRFLRLFPQFRLLETRMEIEAQRRMEAERREAMAQAAGARAETELREWKERYDKQQKHIEELTEKVMNAGDSVALRVLGRRMFSKTPVEAPPQHAKPPINISAGSNKRFGRDAVRQDTADFIRDLAHKSGVENAN